MKRVLTVELLTIILILILISLFTYIDSRQFMLEGFTDIFNSDKSNNNSDNNSENKIILFYAEWCGYCKKMKPEWDNFKKDNPEVCEEYESEEITEELKKKYKINGYPTIVKVQGNNVIPYEGERTREGLTKFLMS